MNRLPDGVASAYDLKAAGAALRLDERQLLTWCRAGYVKGVQLTPGGKWYVPTREVLRVAELFQVTPDWEAALNAE